MSELRAPDPERLPELSGVMRSVFGEPKVPSTYFRVLGIDTPPTLTEFYSEKLDQRAIRIDASDEDFQKHETLQERGAQVLSSFASGEERMLLVPRGAVVISHILPSISKNINRYSDIFNQLGSCVASLERAELGVPESTEPLHNFVFTYNADSPEGTEVKFIPPYKLNPLLKIGDFILRMNYELACNDDSLSRESADFLTNQFYEGLNGKS